MTQVGEGRGAGYGAGAPAGGEILAERYELVEHLETDRAGRQLWHGVDVVLRRRVAIVIHYPGGGPAASMLQTAVEASRIVHPHLVGVYDAIDEQSRAYVVREWVEGTSLRDRVGHAPFDPVQAVRVAHACAAAVTAVHGAGMTHGNVHPGTVLIDSDGRVVLADACDTGATTPTEDLRAVGGLLYFSLTGYWPHRELYAGTRLPDAVRDAGGALASPRQLVPGVPDPLDNLVMDLLDHRLDPPPGDVLTGELGRMDAEASEHGYPAEAYPAAEHAAPAAAGASTGAGASTARGASAAGRAEQADGGPIRLRPDQDDEPARPGGRKLLLGLGGLVAAGVVGLLVGLTWLSGGDDDPTDQVGAAGDGQTPGAATAGPEDSAAGTPTPLALGPEQVRIVDPPQGDRTEIDGVDALVDDDLSTSWRTHQYESAAFGNLKPGMGILLDLGEPVDVASVRVEVASGGATAELRVGDEDPGDSTAGDEEIYQSYEPVGAPAEGGTTMVFTPPEEAETQRYVMVWFTELPPSDDGFQVEVQQVVVEGH